VCSKVIDFLIGIYYEKRKETWSDPGLLGHEYDGASNMWWLVGCVLPWGPGASHQCEQGG